MKTFKVGVSYEMYGYITVCAETEEEAIEKAWEDDIPLPQHNADYIPGSWAVDGDFVEEVK